MNGAGSEPRLPPDGHDGTPSWAYDEDGYCVCCDAGRWRYHMPDCELRDALDLVFAEQVLGWLG